MKVSDLKRGLIVSCQALPEDPLYGCMDKMALAAEIGGAVAVRVNSVKDITDVKRLVSIPVMGIIKKRYPNCNAYITPTIEEVRQVVEAGAQIVAVDATDAIKPDGKTTEQFIYDIKSRFDIIVMGDVSSVEEGVKAASYGIDIVATTLTQAVKSPNYPNQNKEDTLHLPPDIDMIEELASRVSIPVFAEGRYWGPEDTVRAFEVGAHSVVIGSAITRPQLATKRIAQAINKYLAAANG
ncbi:N-acetylmannosamine-6-phosphate 2-epimerase [Paenibacillus hamazuiensis]|uniref:N-acetylmannosamine-6-phosphate 2-epimerase n=1 Tax=Paenibacillus hamazuiensis TaxID=2936508 RepID=UPI00200EC616|nr:N-acetylmannosamine-6-phosphate 2-epimerase [Paenibacillus hamazuiensis]